ncbi:S53 family peptidase [Apilactobacillus timberlakei]|uniref:Aspartyl protease n=1 Tax=Apilactobacillus timberlakei TaxID=2008380 RepID=A0ABY2YUU8_9LACO|nr:S53 family peptidase [Apilactobacillus timberlakei]TPR14073.1 aspartyl protease [Apilactobacillus timberlakei]TPR15389.1 aspartyl protease [Apilactobacillus timberlakei]TPR16920.1 aspartyl protease [Apilactobacillus timberlakei]TPR17280.1 aspartyl protease [Apilactobacillus timberlakei]TPR21430.1 aspartyl protease [Apilactobacillus timberlakei]
MRKQSFGEFILFTFTVLFCLQNFHLVTDVYAKSNIKTEKIKNNPSTVPQKSKSSFLVAMKIKNKNLLNTYVLKKNNKKFISTRQFSNLYGHNKYDLYKIKNYFYKYHLKVKIYRGNFILKVYGSIKNIQEALKFKFISVHKSGINVLKPNHKLTLPKRYQKNIIDIIGLTNYDGIDHKDNDVNKTSDLNLKSNTPQKFINRYNVSPLYNNYKSKSSIGIISFGDFNKSDIGTYWHKMGISGNTSRIKIYNHDADTAIDNNSSDETTMDLEQAGFVNPKANLNLYLSSPTISGLLTSLSDAVSDNKSDTLSLSWGISESEIKREIKLGILSKKYSQIINLILEQAAAQGISVFNSSGDNGAYDGISSGVTSLSVESPSSSPYITSVGATSIPVDYSINGQRIRIDKERAWSNDFLYPYFNKLKLYEANSSIFIPSYFAGTGGGFSKLNSVPTYQKNIKGIGSYNAIKYWDMSSGYAQQYTEPSLVSGKNSGRNVPDIVANGDPQSGYTVYHNNKWSISGGTSIVAPQIAGVDSLMVAKAKHRMGLWNPKIYSFSASHNSPFNPIDSINDNSNIYYVGQPGKTYNQATGLGTVNYYKLYKKMK